MKLLLLEENRLIDSIVLDDLRFPDRPLGSRFRDRFFEVCTSDVEYYLYYGRFRSLTADRFVNQGGLYRL